MAYFYNITRKELVRLTGIPSIKASMATALVRIAFYNDQHIHGQTVVALRNRGLARIEYRPDSRQARKDSGRADGRTYVLTPEGLAAARRIDEAMEFGIDHALTARIMGKRTADVARAHASRELQSVRAVRGKPVVSYVRPIDTNYAFDPDAAPLPIRHTAGVTFGTLEPTGQVSNVRVIRQSDIRACPFVIMVPEHYREDGSCKCDDAEHRAMMIREWGYTEEDFADIPVRDSTPATMDRGDQ